MNRVFCRVNQFTINQNLIVMTVDGLGVEVVSSKLSDFSNAIKALRSKYDFNELVLAGNREYLERLAAEIKTDFDNNELKIEIKELN